VLRPADAEADGSSFVPRRREPSRQGRAAAHLPQ